MNDRIVRRQGLAVWRQIQTRLETGVIGALAPGDRLPTEHELAVRFGVNHHTVRRALRELEEKGLIRIEHGRGAFVHERVVDFAPDRPSFTQTLTRQNRDPRSTLLEARETAADAKVAEALNIVVGTPVLGLATLGYADGRPISISDHYFPLPRFRGLAEKFGETGSITAALALLGVPDYTRKRTRITARPPSGPDADRLRQPKGRPVLITEGVNVDARGTPVDFGITRWASDRMQIVVET